MRTVILIRHGTHGEVGRVLSGRSEIGLNDAGHAEAAALARNLARVPIASLHSSPRRRAQQTIAPVAAMLEQPVRTADALDEIDFGRFTGRTFAALDDDPDWFGWNAERDTARCPGGETMAEATTRALAYLSQLTEADCPTLCVTHCDVIRGIVARLLGLTFDAMFRFDCDPASSTTITLSDHGNRLIALNERVR